MEPASGNIDASSRKASTPTPSPHSVRFKRTKQPISSTECQPRPKPSRNMSGGRSISHLNMSPTSERVETTMHRFAAGSILKLAYGHTVKSIEDQFVVTADRAASRTVEAGSPGSLIVDLFPPCKFIIPLTPLLIHVQYFLVKHIPTWLPGAGFKRNAFSIRKDVVQMLGAPFDLVMNRMVRHFLCAYPPLPPRN
jgi:hypothetical protein